jgi:predicted nuclease of predicted toxin-antitoxin system
LVDEDSQARAQLNLLRADGHDVVAIGELEKNGTADPEVFDLAQSLERVLLTHSESVKRKSATWTVMPETRRARGVRHLEQ